MKIKSLVKKVFVTGLIIPILLSFKTEAAKGKYTVFYNNNSGFGKMANDTYNTGLKLSTCKFTKKGYTFRGWNTLSDGSGAYYPDNSSLQGKTDVTMYAMWEPLMYEIKYQDGGIGLNQYANRDIPVSISGAIRQNEGKTFVGWKGNDGKFYAPGSVVNNLRTGKLALKSSSSFSAGFTTKGKSFKSTQGSCVYSQNGVQYVVTASVLNDKDYTKGNMKNYETLLTKYNLATGQLIQSKRNLQFDHGNSICRNENNGHFYISECGMVAGYPCDLMEVDDSFNVVSTHKVSDFSHVWAADYRNGRFYVLGKNAISAYMLSVLDANFNELYKVNLAQYYQKGYTIQGIAVDDSHVYAIAEDFNAYNWMNFQRVCVFNLQGQYIGTWHFSAAQELEDLTISNDTAYLIANGKSTFTVYHTSLPIVHLKSVWK